MALINCPECENEISSAAEGCPHCGFPVAKYLQEKEAARRAEEARLLRAKKAEAEAAAQAARKKRNGIGCLVMVALFAGCCLLGSVVSAVDDWQMEKEAEAVRLAAEERVEDLRERLPVFLEEVDGYLEREELEKAEALIGELEQASPEDKGVHRRRDQFEEIYRVTLLEEIDEFLENEQYQSATALIESLERRAPENEEVQERRELHTDLKRQFVADYQLDVGRQRLEQGATHRSDEEWIKAEEVFVSALEELDQVHEDYVVSEHDKLRRDLERARSRVASQAEGQREEIAEEIAYRSLCGTRPTQSAWDGHVSPVRRYLRNIAHDPGSIDFEGCTEPVLTADNCWRTTCNYRGKNAFGATIRNSGTFYIRASTAGGTADRVFDTN